MKGKIAFEGHMSLPETLEDSRSFAGESGKWDQFSRRILDVFLDHFYMTTSGNFCDPSFKCALEVMGVDRMMFSADYPFE